MTTKEVTPATLRLSADGTFTATTGCSDLTGTWEAEGSVIRTDTTEEGDCAGDPQGQHLNGVLAEFNPDEQADILTLFGVGDARKIGAIYSKE